MRPPEEELPPSATSRFLRRTGTGLLHLPRAAAFVLALAWMALIWWLSSRPGDDAPASFPGSLFTNGGHVPLFGFLALWFLLVLPREERPSSGRAWPRLDRTRLLGVVLAVLAYGIVDEWHQSTIEGRTASWLDVATDTTAALWVCGVAGAVQWAPARAAPRLLWGALACFGVALLGTTLDWLQP